MLEAELDADLDNVKHAPTTTGIYHNEHSKKTIKSTFGKSEIAVSRDLQGSFYPVLVPKVHNIIDGL